MTSPTIVVTGATGFVGGHVIEALVAAAGPASVVATGRRVERLGELTARTGVAGVPMDLARSDGSERLGELAPDVIVHAAALASPWASQAEFVAGNVTTTRQVLTAAARTGAAVVHLSTPAVYLDGRDRRQIGEDEPLPRSASAGYVATKRRAEELVAAASATTGVPAAILRPQGIVGDGDTTIGPRVLRVLDRGFFPLVDGGRHVVDLTNVANVAAVVVAAASAVSQRAWAGPRVFNVANGEPRTVADLLRTMVEIRRGLSGRSADQVRFVPVPRPVAAVAAATLERLALRTGGWEPPLTRYAVDLLGFDRTLDIGRARNELGFDPARHPLDAGLRDFLVGASPVPAR